MGYPPADLEPEPDDTLRQAMLDLGLQANPSGPAHRRTVLLTAPGEWAWSRGSVMVLLSVSLLRTLMTKARSLGRPRPPRRPGRRLDIRV